MPLSLGAKNAILAGSLVAFVGGAFKYTQDRMKSNPDEFMSLIGAVDTQRLEKERTEAAARAAAEAAAPVKKA